MDRPDDADDRCPRCGHEVADSWLVCAWCGRQLAAEAELPAGSRLGDGRYQILRVIGRGGFGITYEAGDRRLRRRVAVKELFPESAVRHGSRVLTPPHGRAEFGLARDRFLREARVLARFTHPGIVRVYEVFEDHGTAYLVMELLRGRTLVELLRQRGRPFAEADLLDVAGRVAAALRPVHAAGVLHRDINPSNVMLTHHGRIVVIDFGLARDFDEDRTVGMTRVVTPGYAPLEQYRGEARFGPSTDVYGLAATCYRLATGSVPVAAVDRDGGASLPSPQELNPAISKTVADAVLDGLELEPFHRPQDLDAFLARLGVRRLPEGPRSTLLDTVPPPVTDPAVPTAASGATDSDGPRHRDAPARWSDDAGPVDGADDEPVTGPTEIVARPAVPAPAPTPGTDETLYDAGATVYDAGADRTRPPAGAHRGPGPRREAEARRPPAPLPPSALGPRSRRLVTYPMAAMAVASASAAPVVVVLVLVVVLVPLVATIGDSVAHRLRVEHGVAGGWAERRLAPGPMAPVRFVRNVVAGTVRASPVVGVGAVLLAGWYGLDRLSVPATVSDLTLRAIGMGAAGIVCAANREGSRRFRTGLGLDELSRRVTPDGRVNERVVVVWLVAVAVVAAGLWLAPSPFPLP